MALLDQFGHPLSPVSTSRMTARASRDAGAYRGSISGWRGPQVHSPEGESRERDVMQRRAADLAANDWAAHSAVEAISGNAIGTGLVPKASIPADMLGISSESARELGKRMEWAFALWTSEADVRGQCHFADLQNLGIRTMLSLGEMLHLAVMLNEKERERQNRAFSFALQTLSPARLMTPDDQQGEPLIRDGVRLSEYGRPEGYWLATPKASPQSSFVSVERSALLAADFTYVPARVGHRPGVFHLFRHETDEQVRGVSAFSKGIELFRNLSDAISYELFAQVIAASFPVFVALENGGVQLPDYVTEGREGDGERRERQLVQDLSPGQFLYGNENEKPYVLESKRPSANFSAFVEIVLRATAASVGIPYESLTKDFSKTNYSSARAALNEAWKLYSFYRNWFGRLADAAVGKLDRYYNRCREVVHCIEIEPELQAAIRGKGYPLVGTDFLTFWPDEKYDLILMNPPFASGEAHLLHAWEILDHGDIVCLLNEQTLLNPCTSNRKLLTTIIEEHGEVEHLGSCFAEDALRKTQVRVSMVHLRKKREEPKFSFDAGSDEEGAAVFSDGSRFESEVATRDTVGNLVAQYGRYRELFVQIAHLAQELAHYAGPLGTDGGETVGEALKELMRQKPTRRAQEDAYNRFVRSLKKSAWREVLRLTDVRNLASHGVQKEIDRILESNERMAFSEENVYALVESIFLNRGAILQQCVVEAFDIMTRYYDENRVHVEGWKTNDAWKVNRRVVLPRVVSVTFSGSGYLSYGNSRQNLNDIDRAMAFLEGKELESVPCTAVRALEGHLKACGDDFSGVLFESTYFEMRCYKKGTLHMYFKDKGLWERFNLTAARGKNWLPDDVKAREREARARNRRADQYGLPLSA